MEQIDALLDTTILIKIWRGDTKLDGQIGLLKCAVETIVCLEFLQGVSKGQKEKAEKFINRIEFIPFSPMISFKAVELIKIFAHEKGLRMPDALIAAASLEYNIPLLTLNTKDFEFINGINLL